MARWEGSKRVRGFLVAEQGLDTVGWFAPGPVGWTYEFFGRRLKRLGTLVAEGVSTVRDAVLYSLAYEQAREDMRADARRTEARRNILPYSEGERQGSDEIGR